MAKKKTTKKSTKSTHKKTTRKVKKENTETLKNAAIVVLIIALIAVVVWSADADKGYTTSSTTTSTVVAADGDFDISPEVQAAMIELADDDPFIGAEDAPVTIVEFSDFQCPFCDRFRTQTLPELTEKFIETGVVKLVYRDLPLSFHRDAQKAAEAAECADDQGMFWEYHDHLFENQQSLGVNSLKKYAVDLGLDVETFNDCLDSGKYADEVIADAADAAANGISGTPGFVINGQLLSGAQPYDQFERVICGIVPESQPCADIPPPVEFTVTVITDDRCATCDTSQIKAVTLELFPGAEFNEVDASSSEGQALIAEHNLVLGPAYVFPADVRETRTWETNSQIRGAFVESGDGLMLRPESVGASWFFSEEVREEQLAAINTALNRDADDGVPQVDFFVMSYCPYGNQAEELLKPVFDELQGEAIFNPRYVIYNQGTGCYTDDDGTQLCSLHGEVELNQDMRELCVYHEYGEQEWFDFALEMNSACDTYNADTCWEDVAEGLGLSTELITQCFDENKVTFAREQYELNQLLGVRGSPTLFFEGEQFNGARTSNAYLAAICAGFDEAPEACEGVVVEPVHTTTNMGAGCGI